MKREKDTCTLITFFQQKVMASLCEARLLLVTLRFRSDNLILKFIVYSPGRRSFDMRQIMQVSFCIGFFSYLTLYGPGVYCIN